MILKDDPRLNPSLALALKQFGMDEEAPGPPVGIKDPQEVKLGFIAAAEPLYQALSTMIFKSLALPGTVVEKTQVIQGEDGNEISLYISHPQGVKENLPAVLHLHGGGMALLTAADPNYVHWRQTLAAKGLVVIGVEFRNIGGMQGNHPFPAGLNDCYTALKWVNDQKEALGISQVIVSGESGGGNLSLATTLKAKKENALQLIDGVFVQCPYISNQYAEPAKSSLPSLVENDKYVINLEAMNVMASMYDGPSSKNPLAWPYYAKAADLEGLPPHVILVNELDPLRDEGIAYYNQLKAVGIESEYKILKGTIHAAEGLFPTHLPELHQDVQEHIKHFAESL